MMGDTQGARVPLRSLNFQILLDSVPSFLVNDTENAENVEKMYEDHCFWTTWHIMKLVLVSASGVNALVLLIFDWCLK